MREFQQNNRVTYRSLPELINQTALAFETLRSRRTRRDQMGRDVRLSSEAIYNAVILGFVELPFEEQLRFFDAGYGELVRRMGWPAPPPPPTPAKASRSRKEPVAK